MHWAIISGSERSSPAQAPRNTGYERGGGKAKCSRDLMRTRRMDAGSHLSFDFSLYVLSFPLSSRLWCRALQPSAVLARRACARCAPRLTVVCAVCCLAGHDGMSGCCVVSRCNRFDRHCHRTVDYLHGNLTVLSAGMLSARASWAVALMLAAAHWVLAVLASQHNATTFDEVAHISGGMAMVLHGDYRLNPENGVLPQLLAGIAMVAGGGRFPDVSEPRSLEGLSWRHSDSWELGYQILYLTGNDASRMLLLGRAAVALSGFCTVLLVHGSARYVHDGDAIGSLLPTFLAAACPTMLAHGPMITSDSVFTFTASLASTSIWSMLNVAASTAAEDRRLGWLSCAAWAWATGVSVGLVIVAKHSGVIIAPIAVLLLVLHACRIPWSLLPRYCLRIVATVLLSVAVMMATVWSFYRYRYGAFAYLDCHQWKSNWDVGLGSQHGRLTGTPALLVDVAKAHRLLPEAMLYGMSYAFLSTHARACFLAGRHGTRGWRLFFPYAMAVKTPSGVLVLVVLAILAAFLYVSPQRALPHVPQGSPRAILRKGLGVAGSLWHHGGAAARLTPLLVLLSVYGAVALNQSLNIGHRHMLPVYPPLYVLCGLTCRYFAPLRARAAPEEETAGRARGERSEGTGGGRGGGGLVGMVAGVGAMAVVCAMCWVGWEVGSCYPFYIPFFNGVSGGPERGYTHLVDSSLDWGQALPALRSFIERESHVYAEHEASATPPRRPNFYVSYFGLGNPLYYNISDTERYAVMHLHSSVSGVSRPKHVQEVRRSRAYCCILLHGVVAY